jgi:hypothetical protein
MPVKSKRESEAKRELNEIVADLTSGRKANKQQIKSSAKRALDIINTINHKGALAEIIKSKSNLFFYEADIPASECTCGYRISASGGCSCGSDGYKGYKIDLRAAAKDRLQTLNEQ